MSIERNARLLCRADGRDPDRRYGVVNEENGDDCTNIGWRLYASEARRLAAAGLTILPVEPEPHEGCACQDCGRKYRVDVMVPDAMWEKLKPAGKAEGAGLLCGACIGARVEAISDFDAFSLLPVEPDEATVERVGPDDAWPPAVSDGLTLACGLCGIVPAFDYRVTEEAWKELAPEFCRLGVICLPCLDGLATQKGRIIGDSLIEVNFTGTGHTVVLRAARVIDYRARAAYRAAVGRDG